ncbi:amino acid permease/ SLC12A domain-containing protein [Scheffersomyces coipomensis]|uniref:amino acid permease/ SLC12A domain-containing protein n=1 Tax=Scheffersomyces coipomensis TaxID=1788519 RepID=UPI00315D5C7D
MSTISIEESSSPKKTQITEVAVESDVESLNYSTENEKVDYFYHEKRLSSALKARHIGMITLVGVFGTGLFLSSSVSLSTAGPVGMLLAYIMVGLVIGANQMCIAEVSCLLPVTSAYVKHAEHFVDESLGFAMGWIDIYSSILPGELSAVAVVMTFWSDLNPAIWITVYGLVVVLTNVYNVKWYGEIEFFFGILKILLVVGIVILGLVIDLGGVKGQQRLGFHYWRDPGPFAEKFTTGSLGKFAGFWKCVSSVVYAYGGTQAISMLAGETEYPRRAIFRAAKRVFYRVFTMYLTTVFILTLLVAYNDPEIANPNGTAAGSPFVIAMKRAGVRVVPHIINGVVLTSALSAANLGVIKASRTLFALATKKQAPSVFLWVNRHGLPWVGVTLACLFLSLCYMSVTNSASNVFNYFQNVSSSALLFNWIVIALNHIHMSRALTAQGYTRKDLPYTFYGTQYASWFSLFFSVLFLLTGGFANFIKGNFEFSSFFAAYFVIPLGIILFIGWKFFRKTKYLKPEEVDLKGLFADIQNTPEPAYPKLKGWEYITLLWG